MLSGRPIFSGGSAAAARGAGPSATATGTTAHANIPYTRPTRHPILKEVPSSDVPRDGIRDGIQTVWPTERRQAVRGRLAPDPKRGTSELEPASGPGTPGEC